jgi:hypothetical protein
VPNLGLNCGVSDKTKTKPKRMYLFLHQKVTKGVKTKVKPKKDFRVYLIIDYKIIKLESVYQYIIRDILFL